MLGRAIAAKHQYDHSWDIALEWLDPYAEKADVVLANLESPIALPLKTTDLHFLDLRAPKVSLYAFNKYKYVLLSVANNHIYDEGRVGAFFTEKTIVEKGFYPVGLSNQPLLLEIKGIRLAIFAWDDVINNIDIHSISEQIYQARNQGYWVIVSVHWGAEYSLGVIRRQQQLAQAFVDAGANFVWGHHPHVLQPIDCIIGKNQRQPSIIAYSMGNALFDQMTPPYAKIGSALLMILSQNGIIEIQLIPFEILPSRGKITTPEYDSYRKAIDQLTYFIHRSSKPCKILLANTQ